ncbi:helix-turn-helix domain-containing protein [uncultured Corynebacterium sp.]|uniref:helix-turn-helix domain-containing protein n=1 Tax=uncultured Corynebacterium sp. TaxID=159447 RepID=UPI0025F0AF93|nr:helix-turn-helix transcriptional regulator [uncultured Corynebacterium sp.]
MSPSVSPFPSTLAQLIADRGLSQAELARRVGVTPAAMSRYLSGDREPRFVTLTAIAEELGVHVNELLQTSDEAVPAAIRTLAIARRTLSQAELNELRTIIDQHSGEQ